MGKHLSIFLAASFLFLSQSTQASSMDDTLLSQGNEKAPSVLARANKPDQFYRLEETKQNSLFDQNGHGQLLDRRDQEPNSTSEKLDLSNNQLTDTPVLSGFEDLRELDLSNNQLIDAPDLSRLTSLVRLDLDHNQLRALSDLSRLTNLVKLYLSHNQLTAAPDLTLPNLELLDLSYNQLTDAPDFSRLPKLKWLYLDLKLYNKKLVEILKGLYGGRHHSQQLKLWVCSIDANGNTVQNCVSLN